MELINITFYRLLRFWPDIAVSKPYWTEYRVLNTVFYYIYMHA